MAPQSNMTGVLLEEDMERGCADGGRDWSFAITKEAIRILEAPKLRERLGIDSRVIEKSESCKYIDFRLLAFKTRRE